LTHTPPVTFSITARELSKLTFDTKQTQACVTYVTATAAVLQFNCGTWEVNHISITNATAQAFDCFHSNDVVI